MTLMHKLVGMALPSFLVLMVRKLRFIEVVPSLSVRTDFGFQPSFSCVEIHFG